MEMHPNVLGNMPHLAHMALVMVGRKIGHLKSVWKPLRTKWS